MIFKIILLANLLIFTISCNKTNNSVDSKYTDPIKYYKDYWPNESGNLDSTEMAIHDFASASECFDCHGQYFSEWSKSRHAHSFDDPIFQKGWNEAQIDFPDTASLRKAPRYEPANSPTNAPIKNKTPAPMNVPKIPPIIAQTADRLLAP